MHKVQAGDTCYLAQGDYFHDGLTVTHGEADNPITITGHPEACIKGSNTQDRVLQIAHNYYIIDGICFDGEHDDEYVATAIYILGADRKSTIEVNGIESKSSVTGTQLINLEIKNFSSECIHFRYFVTWTEMRGCTVQHCGIAAFGQGEGGKVGEACYIGTALDQVDDNKVTMNLSFTHFLSLGGDCCKDFFSMYVHVDERAIFCREYLGSQYALLDGILFPYDLVDGMYSSATSVESNCYNMDSNPHS